MNIAIHVVCVPILLATAILFVCTPYNSVAVKIGLMKCAGFQHGRADSNASGVGVGEPSPQPWHHHGAALFNTLHSDGARCRGALGPVDVRGHRVCEPSHVHVWCNGKLLGPRRPPCELDSSVCRTWRVRGASACPSRQPRPGRVFGPVLRLDGDSLSSGLSGRAEGPVGLCCAERDRQVSAG